MITNWSLRRRLSVLLFLLLIAFASTAVVALLTVRARDDAQHERTTQLEPARLAVDDLLSAAIDQETGVRGYLITGAEASLQPYTAGRRNEARATATLARLLGRPDSIQALHVARDALGDWQDDAAAPVISARRAGDVDGAGRPERTGISRQRFDAVRDSIASLRASVDADVEASDRDLDHLRN